MTNNLRLYTFCNFYLSSFQQGNQSGHLATKMSAKYRHSRGKPAKVFRDWEDDGVTTIVLNGGDWSSIIKSYIAFGDLNAKLITNPTFKKRDFHIPFCSFEEEPGALSVNPTTTCWGFILPPEIYNAKKIEVFPSRIGYATVTEDKLTSNDYFFEEGSLEYLACESISGKSLAR